MLEDFIKATNSFIASRCLDWTRNSISQYLNMQIRLQLGLHNVHYVHYVRYCGLPAFLNGYLLIWFAYIINCPEDIRIGKSVMHRSSLRNIHHREGLSSGPNFFSWTL